MTTQIASAAWRSFDNLHTLRRSAFRRRITRLSDSRMGEARAVMSRALGCV